MSDDPKIQDTQCNPAAEAEPQQTKTKKEIWIYRISLLAGLLLPVLLETIDYTVVATAQPHIASAFNRLDLQSWIGTAYLLTSTVFLPLYASFADLFGRHAAIQTALLLFLIGSALSTGAQNMPMMLAGRGVAGIGAAGLLTIVRIILADSRGLDENTFQTSGLIILYAIAYSAGPWIGGALVSISFRWVFAINLPSGVAGMIVIFILLRNKLQGPQPSGRKRKREALEPGTNSRKTKFLHKLLGMDFVGALLFIVGFILILLGLTWGSTSSSGSTNHANSGWATPKVIVLLVVGGVLLIATGIWEWQIERYDKPGLSSPTVLLDAEPLLPAPIFANLDSVICQYVSFTSGMVMFVMFYFVAIFFTIVSGQDPKKAGGQLVYFAPGMGTGVNTSLFLIKFLRQPRYPILFGSIILPVSLGLISMAMQRNSIAMVDGFLALAGAGVGLSFGPIGIHARFSQPPERIAVVQGLQLFFRTLGGVVGIAQCATVMNSKVTAGITDLIRSGVLSLSDITSSQASSSSAAGIASLQQIQNLPGPSLDAVREVFRNGVRWAFLSLVPWVSIATILSLFLTNIVDPDEEKKKAKKAAEEEVDKQKLEEYMEKGDFEYVELGPEPKYTGWTLIQYVIFRVKKGKWEKRKAEIDQCRAAQGLVNGTSK